MAQDSQHPGESCRSPGTRRHPNYITRPCTSPGRGATRTQRLEAEVRQSESGQKVQTLRGTVAEENSRLQELIVEELAQAERWQGHYEGLLGRQARLHALLQAQSLESLEQAARALRDELEEAQGALREQQEQSRRCHVHQREKENQRLAETIQELEGKVSKQRAWEKTHKQALQQLRVQGDELQRQLWDVEAKRQAKADRIWEKQRHVEKLSGTIRGLARRTQVLHRNISCWGDRVLEARQEAELFQREVLYGPLGTPPGSLLWEERVRDQTEKLLCQESGASGPRGRLPPRLRLAGLLFWGLAKGLFLALLGTLVLGPVRVLLSCQPHPPPAGPRLSDCLCPKETLSP